MSSTIIFDLFWNSSLKIFWSFWFIAIHARMPMIFSNGIATWNKRISQVHHWGIHVLWGLPMRVVWQFLLTFLHGFWSSCILTLCLEFTCSGNYDLFSFYEKKNLLWHLSCEDKLKKLGLFILKTWLLGDLTAAFQYLKGTYRKDGEGHFIRECGDRTRNTNLNKG